MHTQLVERQASHSVKRARSPGAVRLVDVLVVGGGSVDVVVSPGAGEAEVLLGYPNLSLGIRGLEVGRGSRICLLDQGASVTA